MRWSQILKNDILKKMWNDLARRFLVVVLSAAIASGFAIHSVHAGDANATTIVAATVHTDMPMPAPYDGCAGDQKVVGQGTCMASCTSVAVLPPTIAGIDAVLLGTVGPAVGPIVVGHAFPPDPHPPKPSYLS